MNARKGKRGVKLQERFGLSHSLFGLIFIEYISFFLSGEYSGGQNMAVVATLV